jgi:hypothetical protein
MSQSISITAKEMFDRKFVVAAIVIGVAYTTIVVVLGTLIGKDAAGIAGVALTALATGIFKQFETLRFRQQTDDSTKSIELPAFRIWYFLLILFAFIGVQVVLGAVLGSIIGALGWMPDMTRPETLLNLLTDKRIWISIVGLTAIGYFIGGYLIGKTAPSVTYTYAIVATFLTNLLTLLLQVIPLLVRDLSAIKIFAEPSTYTSGIFWLLFVFVSLIGAKLGFRKNIPSSVEAMAVSQPE